MADAVILLVLVLAALWGLNRGLVGPLLGEIAFVVSLFAVYRLHADRVLWPVVPHFAASLVALAGLTLVIGILLRPLARILTRMPPIRAIDRPAGAAAHALIAFIAIYLVLGAILDFDTHVYPLIATGVVTAQELDSYSGFVSRDPALSQYMDQAQLRQLRAAASQHPIPVSDIERVQRFLDFYVHNVRDPLLVSRLAPLVNSVGGHVPVLGHPRHYFPDANPGGAVAAAVSGYPRIRMCVSPVLEESRCLISP
jgi:uncharacterized membrane protein required for colicin V production